jgi:carboxymethylenebutenolidase
MKNVALISLFALLAPQDPVTERLEKSPRHHEWVQIKVGERTLHAFVVFPEVKEKAAAIVVIHENKGLNDWARSAADQFAEAGLIAIAPDLLSGLGPNGGKTSDFPSADAATQALYKLPPDQVTADLNACADYVAKLPACTGKVAVGGFCWGGGKTFNYAASGAPIKAGFVFYGSAPKPEQMAGIKSPVYGFYGGNDARISAAVPDVTQQMKTAGKKYDPVIYEGAGHGFMRAGEDPAATDPNKKAREESWTRVKQILAKI